MTLSFTELVEEMTKLPEDLTREAGSGYGTYRVDYPHYDSDREYDIDLRSIDTVTVYVKEYVRTGEQETSAIRLSAPSHKTFTGGLKRAAEETRYDVRETLGGPAQAPKTYLQLFEDNEAVTGEARATINGSFRFRAEDDAWFDVINRYLEG